MDLDEFTQKWFAMELRLGLFADRAGGMPWWDAIRYRVFEYVFDGLAGTAAPAVAEREVHARALNFVRRMMLSVKLRMRTVLSEHDMIVLRAPRQTHDGRPLDAGLDDLIALCPGRKVVIDTYPLYYHLPRRGVSRRRVHVGNALDRVVAALESEFGATWKESGLRAMIARLLADFVDDLAAYGRLFDRVRPRFILMTQNGLEKACFAAAHARGIPVIEAQHGLIGATHAAYSYPKEADYGDRSTFPTVFTVFSEYWLHNCHYPARRCVTLGNDRFAVSAQPPLALGDIMFISADIYHRVLLEWVGPLARAVPERRVIYKLHANQTAVADAIRREFGDFTNVEVVDGSTSARALMPKVSHVVLIQSTVALEALQMGRRLCILPFQNYRVHEDLFALPAVTVISDMNSLSRAVREAPDPAPPPVFFDPLDVEGARALLQDFARGNAD